MLRTNLGKAIEDAADLYDKSSNYYLDFDGDTVNAVSVALARELNQQSSMTEILSRMFSTQSPNPEFQHRVREQVEELDRFWTHDTITSISNEAFAVLAKLQTESARLRNVSSESAPQILFHFFGGGKERCRRDLRRAKRYNEAIEAMKRVVWPLVSFRLLLPLISLSHTLGEEQTDEDSARRLQQRIRPTRETLRSFNESLKVMRRLGAILKDHTKPLSAFSSDWQDIDCIVNEGHLLIQLELSRLVKLSMYEEEIDGLKLLTYYGFVVRCSMIWEGLKTVAEKLTPLKGTMSRTSSIGVSSTPLPNQEVIHAPD